MGEEKELERIEKRMTAGECIECGAGGEVVLRVVWPDEEQVKNFDPDPCSLCGRHRNIQLTFDD